LNIFDVFEFDDKLQILDVGAAIIKKEGIYTDIPIYKKIIDMGLAQLTAFDGDKRHTEKFLEYYERTRLKSLTIFYLMVKSMNFLYVSQILACHLCLSLKRKH
jgi:hypothetical protein